MSMLDVRHLSIPDVAGRDRRRGQRFSLSLACSCLSPASKFGQLAGTTLDMSRTGVLARLTKPGASEVLPQAGETARLEIDLPASPIFSPRFLNCMARVVRVVDVETDHITVAFELRRVRVEERHKKASGHTATILAMPDRLQ
jgi:hypothetical protein